MQPDEARGRLRGFGFSEDDAETLFRHFQDAERRGKRGHGFARIAWLSTLAGFDPSARPLLVRSEPGHERWDGGRALGYLTLAAIVRRQLADPPSAARVVVVANCFPTGVLGYWARLLAEGGLLAVLTATSPRRLSPPDGGPPLAGTNPLAIGIPSSNGRPVVADVSMGKVTYGEVLTGDASLQDLVPFGGEQAHKAFALAVGLQLLVDSLVGDGYGALLVVARPEHDPVPALREAAGGARLPGDA